MQKNSNVFGLSFTNITLEKLGNEILAGMHSKKIIVTPNVDHIVRFHRDLEFGCIYSKSDLFVNDSRVLKLLSAFGLDRIKTLVTGSDLTRWLFENSGQNLAVTIIGSSKATVTSIRENFPHIKINHFNPIMGFIEDKAEVEKTLLFCEKNPADIFFLAVGSPRQEILASMLKARIEHGALLCIGASLLFLSGEEVRAPRLFQLLHVEWLFRLLQNPNRLYKRYLVEGPMIFKIYIVELLKNFK